MENQHTRRSALRNIAGGAAVLTSAMLLPGPLRAANLTEMKLKGRIKHSVCKWCYNDIPLEELCKAAKGMGLSSIELLGPNEWPTLKKYGLTCAMAWGAEKSLTEGFNNPMYHDELVEAMRQ